MNKRREQRKRGQHLHRLLLWTLLLINAACAPEESIPSGQGPVVNLRMEIQSRATGEDAIQRVRIIVTDAATDAVQFNQLIQGTQTPLTVKARAGKRHFYTIINEASAMTQALGAVENGEDIEKLRINYVPPQANTPMMMYAQQKDVTVAATGNPLGDESTVTYTDAGGTSHTNAPTLTMNAERLLAKVSLTFIKNNPDFTVKNLSIKILRIPQYAYIGTGNEYTEPAPGWNDPAAWSSQSLPQTSSAELLADNTATWDENSHTYSYGTTGARIDFADFYLPEYLLPADKRGDMDCSTVLIVNGTCVMQGRDFDANWRIELMANNFRIDRNTHYNIAARIEGMGSMGIYAEIAPVTEHNIPVNWKPLPGLAIVSDRTADYGDNRNVANDVAAYSGILKIVQNSNGTNTYHNLLFKQGSVVGISDEPGSYAPAQVLYNPKIAEATYQTNTYAAIPASNSGVPADNTLEALRAGIGDPCQLVGVSPNQLSQGKYSNGQWHTATGEEYQRLIDNKDATQEATGWKSFQSLLLPPTAYRATNGATTAATTQGDYWSRESGTRFAFTAGQTTATVQAGTDAQQAHAVRCVRNTIPPTSIDVANKNANYTVGYTGGKVEIEVLSNAPQWTATGPHPMENASGAFNGKLVVNVPRRESTTSLNYTITLRGTGYDGKEAQRNVTLTQGGYQWRLQLVSHTLPTDNARLPAAGGSYQAVVKLSPADIAVPSNAKCTLTISASGMDDIVETPVAIDGTSRQATLTFQAPANIRNDIRRLTFAFETKGSGIPTYDGKISISIIQEKP